MAIGWLTGRNTISEWFNKTAERPGLRPRLRPHGRSLKDCRNQGKEMET
jgi:hypothetical protein